MENHPIPQDVTGFQFKLIGDMTVKQFAYLAGGVVSAFVVYLFPISFLFRLPFIILFAGLGVALAFLPIEGRPFDVMVMNFLKALFSPNQYLYHKVGGTIAIFQMTTTHVSAKKAESNHSAEKLQMLLTHVSSVKQTNKLDEKESTYFQSLSNMSAGTFSLPRMPHILSQQSDMPQVPQQAGEEQDEELAKEAEKIQKELEAAKVQEVHPAPSQTPEQAHQKVSTLEHQLAEIMAQKDALERQLLTLSQKLDTQKRQALTPSDTPKPQTQNVRKVPKNLGKAVGLPIVPDVPNVLLGIVKDPRGNVLPNILVEVRDTEGSPVRAFKTNALGQFAAATAMANGVYTVVFEDPEGKHKFDTIELVVNGEILQPLEVISTDAREQLRKELFG